MRNKIIIITGGLGLLGEQFVSTLSEEDNYVVSLDTHEKVDAYNFLGLDKHKTNKKVIACDITNEEEVMNIVEYIYYKFGQINILINCAAYNEQPNEETDNSFGNYSLEKWKKTIDTNLTGTFLMSRECIKYMLRNKVVVDKFRGSIINIASDLGVIAPDQDVYENGYVKPADYGVSKAGVINLTKYIASYFGNIIKSICLAPGGVYDNQSDIFVDRLTNKIPMGRMARKDEYNGIIKFLCSVDSNYMQGQTLIADGGRSII